MSSNENKTKGLREHAEKKRVETEFKVDQAIDFMTSGTISARMYLKMREIISG